MTQYGAYPLDRKGVGLNAYRWAIDQLARDQVIVIFPEGTRSRTGMKRALPGVTKLALETQAAILPVGITGTERFGHWMRVFNPTGTITVNIGEAFYLPSLEGKISKEVLRSLTDMIMKRIAELLPSNYHGIYKDTGQSNKVGLIDHNYFKKISPYNLDFLENKKILAETNNEFEFKIDSKKTSTAKIFSKKILKTNIPYKILNFDFFFFIIDF